MTNIQNNLRTANKLHLRRITKYMSKKQALELMRYVPQSKLYKSYKNTSFCNELLGSNEVNKIYTSYCKNRWCQTCNRIKMAKTINNYIQDIQQMQYKTFVTLTLPTCTAEQLPSQIDRMEKAFRLITNKALRAKYKKEFPKFRGIRKTEITLRPGGLYHYHFHVLVEYLHVANWLISEWLNIFPDAKLSGQDMRPAIQNTEKELFKYTFKSDIELNGKTSAKRYDIVFNALHKKRSFSTFGGIKQKSEDFEESELINGQLAPEPNQIYKWNTEDWYNNKTGEALLNFPMTQKEKTKGLPKNISQFAEFEKQKIQNSPILYTVENKK